jgi:hypothetical protein
VNEHTCACGYTAANAEDLRDHFAEMFTPGDDTAPDGQAHAEAVHDTAIHDNAVRDPASTGRSCLCGFTGDSIADLDEHFARAFTPADRIGRDGARHAPASAGQTPEADAQEADA